MAEHGRPPGAVSFFKDHRQVYRLKELDELEWLDYGFGTQGAGEWAEGPLVLLRQVHSDVCVRVDQVPGERPVGDALLTDTLGLLLGVKTADCLPILIADRTLRAVAAVHAGWRGTALGVSAKAVEALGREFGSKPGNLEVAIGPGICGGCYEVGPEVARQFGTWLPELAGASGRVRLDLTEINRRQLTGAGVDPGKVHWGAPCTACTPAEFHSYRRDRSTAGRDLSVIGIRPR